MPVGRRLIVAGLWACSLVGVAAWARPQEPQRVYPGGRPAPDVIIAGENIGFRLEGKRGSVQTGTLVVRIDGKWVEAQSSLKVVPAR